MIQTTELSHIRIHPTQRAALLMAATLAEQGATVTVSLNARKATDTPERRPDADFVQASASVPGDLHIGEFFVKRRVDNAKNRRDGTVGTLYFLVKDVLRADGFQPFGWTNVRPEEITAFKVLGVVTPEPQPEAEMATVALAQATETQTQAPAQGA